MALIEALVASAVLGIGLAGATRLTMHALQTASDTRQHTVAHALAVNALECLHDGRADCALNASFTLQGTTYTVQSQRQPHANLAVVDVQVRVQWPVLGRRPAGTPTSTESSGAADDTGQRLGDIVLTTRRDEVPSWVGVSLP
jgi:Tfp pilus assembly protein PilV